MFVPVRADYVRIHKLHVIFHLYSGIPLAWSGMIIEK